MPTSMTVLLKIAAMFLVILTGWVARRKNYLTDETTASLSKFVVDITIPALVFTQMLGSVNRDGLKTDWVFPVYGGAIFIVGQLVGLVTMYFFSKPAQRPTFIFLVSLANWIYLPLPIVEALYGAEGVKAILLFNVGAQIILWTMGVWTLRGGKIDLSSLKELAKNPGLIATALGIAMVLIFPALGDLTRTNTAVTSIDNAFVPIKSFIDALTMIGALTIPLSLIVTGAQLGGLDTRDHRPSLELSGVLLSRLFIAPALCILLIVLLRMWGWDIPQVPRMVAFLIASMPVAVSCSIFTERFGGDTSLAARGTFISTLLSIATVPAIFYLVTTLGL